MRLMPILHDQEAHWQEGWESHESSRNQDDTDRDRAKRQARQHRVVSLARLRRCACGRAVAHGTRQKVGAATKQYPRPLRAEGFQVPRSDRRATRWAKPTGSAVVLDVPSDRRSNA